MSNIRSRRPSTSSSGLPFSAFHSSGSRSILTAATGNRNRSNNTVPSNRPITGTGGVARKIKPFTPQTNVVHNAAFYSNLLQTKTTQILDEMERLRDEIGDEDSRRALEKKLDDVRQQVRVL
eukprot:scaffold9756_cov139-Skeletonema_menzelii.AAC.5